MLPNPRISLWLLASVLTLALLAVHAPTLGAAEPASSFSMQIHEEGSPSPVLTANIGNYFNQCMQFIYNTFRSRERVIQFVIVGMCLGLFIMLRRMPGKV